MNYTHEPPHSELLTVQGTEPFNAEPVASALVEFEITPEDLVYCRNHGPVNEYSEETYTLVVKRGDTTPLRFSLADLRSFPKADVVAVLQVSQLTYLVLPTYTIVKCAGNRRNEMGAIKKVNGVGWNDGVVANCKWAGVRLCHLLKHAGVQHGEYAHACFASYATLCQDDTYYGASIPLEKAMTPEEDVLLAYEVREGDPYKLYR
jgi:sulfite oxidase